MTPTTLGRRAIPVLLATTMLAAPQAAFAQDAPQGAEAENDGEIIVTANRREENLQDVPISVTALGEARLEEAHVASFDDYAKLLPSVSFQSFGPSQSQIFFRGVSSGGDGLHIGPLPTSSLYLDEIPLTTIAGSVDVHVYDIARVEALAGPQGTLFGASSLSGTLRIITNQPSTTEFSGSIDVTGTKWGKGDYGGSIEGYVNLPLSDRAALRVVGFYDKQGGYIDNIPGTRTFTLDDDTLTDPAGLTNLTVNNSALVEDDYNDVETYGGRAALKVDLDDNWTVTPQIIYQRQVTNGGFLFDPRKGDLKVTDYLPSRNEDRWYQAALTIQGKLSDWDITYAGGYFERKTDNLADYSYYTVAYDSYGYYATFFPTATPGVFLDPTQSQVLSDDYTKLTQELRVSSPADKSMRVTAGLFLQHQTDRVRADYEIAGIGANIGNGQLFFPDVHSGGDSIFRTRIRRKDRDYAMFAQGEADLTPTITLIAGLRGFIAHNTIYGFSGFNGGSTLRACIPGLSAPEVPCVNVDKKQVEDGVIWKGGVRWKPSDDLMLYSTVSRGYRPGGNNRRPGLLPFVSDTLDNYEVGAKARFGPFTLNTAAFYAKWKDLQFGLVPLGQNGVTNTYNAGDARIYGIEGDISARFGGLKLSAAGTYVDAQLTTDFCVTDPDDANNIDCTLGVAAPRGTRLPVMPKFKGNATARYEFPFGANEAFVQGAVFYQSGTRSFLTDADFAAVGPTKGFTTFDFAAGIDWNRMRFEVFVQNAFDKRGALTLNTACATTFCGPFARTYPVKPQLFGIKAGVDF